MEFSNLDDEINAIEQQFRLTVGMIRLVREENLDTLFLKLGSFVEIKIVLQRDYPKVPPNLLKVLYFKNADPALEEALEDFFRSSTLTLNDIVDRRYGKCCILSIYKEMKRLIDGNKYISGILSGAVKQKQTQSPKYELPEVAEALAESPEAHFEVEEEQQEKTSWARQISLKKPEAVNVVELKYGEVREWSVQSALAIIAPKNSTCDVVQNIREKYDKTFDRWPPHINLLYPFVETLALDLKKAGDDLRRVLEKHEAFDMCLSKMNHFANNSVVYLEPNADATSRIAGIQRDLAAYFGQSPSKSNTEFKPHMTIAQPEQRRDAGKNWSSKMMETIKNEFGRLGISTVFRVNAVFWITRQGNEPFRVKHAFPLGENSKIDENSYRLFNYN